MKKANTRNQHVLRLALLGLFAALILLMSFTPIGYLKVGIVEITFIVIPVAVGAVILGPGAGALLGAIFGITSFIQAVSGMSPFGAALMSINGIYTFILCLVPRILMGLLAGLLFKALTKENNNKRQLIASGAASLAAPLLNTVLFVGGLALFFWNSDYIQSMAAGSSLLAFAVAFVGINGLIEAVSCFIIGTAASKALLTLQNSKYFA